MAYLRFKALETVGNRETVKVTVPSFKVSDYYGTNVYGTEAMRQTLSNAVLKK